VQLELLNSDEGQAIISIQIDNGIRTNIVGRSKEIGEIVKTEITDINLIVSTNTSRKISNGVITGTVPEHEEVIAPQTCEAVIPGAANQDVTSRATR